MLKRYKQVVAMAALSILAAYAPSTLAEDAKPTTNTEAAFRFDCMHNFNVEKGGAQDCLTITGLRLSFAEQLNPAVKGSVSLDPFSTPRSGSEDSPLRDGLPTTADTQLGIISAYKLAWMARPNLQVAVQTYDGAAQLPSVSDLAFGNTLADTGWRQSAMTITYNLTFPTTMNVTFAAGNGEGETVHSKQPQRYFGFEANAAVTKSVRAQLGVSLDGNDVGSEEYGFLTRRYAENCALAMPKDPKLGHSTQRIGTGIIFDGSQAGANGLKAALGWQRNTVTDLDKLHGAGLTASQLAQNPDCQLDPDVVFPEPDDSTLNEVRRTTYGVSLNYRLFTNYFVAADYSHRTLDTGSVKAFHVCHSYASLNQCVDQSDFNALQQDAMTVGGGMDLAPGLTMTLEYFKTSYDKTYTQIYYLTQNGKPGSTLEVFNARLAYNW